MPHAAALPCGARSPGRPSLRILALGFLSLGVLLLTTACSEQAPPADIPGPVTADQHSQAPTAWFLRPRSWTVRRDQPTRVVLDPGPLAAPIPSHGDARLDAPPLLDPVCARVGGFQDNQPPVSVDDDGQLLLRPTFPIAGDAVVACSTAATEDAAIAYHAKCLLRVVADAQAPAPLSAQVAARIGLAVELVPLIDPLALPPGELLPVQVRAGGPARPAVSVQVWVEDEQGETVALPTAVTDTEGVALIELEAAGVHLLRAAVTLPPAGDGEPVEHIATLTFERGGRR